MIQTKTQPLQICLFGASPDTGNQGVTALCHATLSALAAGGLHRVTLFDHGTSMRRERWSLESHQLDLFRHGAVHSRRIYRPESLRHLRLSTRLRGFGNAGARAILNADAILDLSAGDSFTDLYGARRWEAVVQPKLLALQARRPLILLPQTYGPFQSPKVRQLARHIVQHASLAMARDHRSLSSLQELMGADYCPARHQAGVDMAFLLPAVAPRAISERLMSWLSGQQQPQQVVGFNVSGLMYNRADEAARQFGLQVDYRGLVLEFLRWLLQTTSVRILLVPHVEVPLEHAESDLAAALRVKELLGTVHQDRVEVLAAGNSPSELKWLIGRTSWFCGTRMHSTIAATSSGVPTAALSYSIKTKGVFETLGLGDSVLELRQLNTDQALCQLQNAWYQRRQTEQRLRNNLSRTLKQAQRQAEAIVQLVRAVGQREGNRP